MMVMFNVTDPVEGGHAMSNREVTPVRFDRKAVLTSKEMRSELRLRSVL